jgi:CTD small phosphatase-like protein 2
MDSDRGESDVDEFVQSKKPKRESTEDDNILDCEELFREGLSLTPALLAPIEELDESSSTSSESGSIACGAAAGVITQVSGPVEEFDALAFMACVPARSFFASQLEYIARRGTLLHRAPSDVRPCLVLDLDETLVHSSLSPLPDADFVFPVEMPEGEGFFTVYAKKRPHCDHFLRMAARQFELVIFTASKRVYADRVLDFLDPQGVMLTQRLFREHCVFFGGAFLKDLSVLNRDLAKTVIVDNSPQTFSLDVHNGIPIESFVALPEQSEDTQLLGLLTLLDHLAQLGDVRPFLRDHFQLHDRARERRAQIKAN